ncbi:hypothetical protein [Lysobacter sp. CA196]|uniref:hypothetical protein n=1 Tax=Lysobacter sp. CA196 TaxID=3455606 RepID=UPI003F8D76B9
MRIQLCAGQWGGWARICAEWLIAAGWLGVRGLGNQMEPVVMVGMVVLAVAVVVAVILICFAALPVKS